MTWESILPVLIVLACPLIMIFMMRGHHHQKRYGAGGTFDGMSDEQLEEVIHRARMELEHRGSSERTT